MTRRRKSDIVLRMKLIDVHPEVITGVGAFIAMMPLSIFLIIGAYNDRIECDVILVYIVGMILMPFWAIWCQRHANKLAKEKKK